MYLHMQISLETTAAVQAGTQAVCVLWSFPGPLRWTAKRSLQTPAEFVWNLNKLTSHSHRSRKI